MRCLLLLFACLIAASGCVNRVHYPFDEASSSHHHAKPKFIKAHYSDFHEYDRQPVEPFIQPLPDEHRRHYDAMSLELPATGINGQKHNLVTAHYYQSKLSGKKKLVIMLPIWGSHTYPPEKMTYNLLKRSGGEINVLRIMGDDYLFDWEGLRTASDKDEFIAVNQAIVERLIATATDIRRLIDWAERRTEIDANRIGLVAFSIGAMLSAPLLQVEPRIAVAVLVMASANPHEVLATCFGRAEQTRNTIMQRFDLTLDEYQAILEEVYRPVNARAYEGQVNPASILMFDAAYDDCMPQSARDALWYAMGEPERITLRYRHKIAFLAMTPVGLNYIRKQIFNFIDKRL